MAPTSPLILLVEDDPDDVMLFKRALKKVRVELDLLVARDGDEAVELLSRTWTRPPAEGHVSPSHVILDLKLPRKSGLEVLEWIRKRPELGGLKVVVLTSSDQPQDLERGRRAGIDHYYVKPPGFPQLLEILRNILRDWRLMG
jgi:CheY-like chemotaxis protein